MTADAEQILANLEAVAAERAKRLADPILGERVRVLKAYQHARFEGTYADLLRHPRYARAARFFLEDLYGPHDFTERDGQFARIVPALVRLFPPDIVRTVRALAELHALSETLDTRMAEVIGGHALDAAAYKGAWQSTAQPAEREHQIALMLSVGEALERYTRNPLLRHSLRLMRGPAKAAGLGALQSFLERGFDTFREMRGAAEFLSTIAQRERGLSASLFAQTDPPAVVGDTSATSGAAPPPGQSR